MPLSFLRDAGAMRSTNARVAVSHAAFAPILVWRTQLLGSAAQENLGGCVGELG
jgi:hypothetical protein